jgi:AcrR family transcriptional regulator
MSVTESVGAVRPPMQERSREAWDRILEAALQILITEGRAALTIAAVCARAKVAPTAIYARVDGIAGLFWALYESQMLTIFATQETLFAEAEHTKIGSQARVDAVVRAVAVTFREHEAFLHPIINYSANDPALQTRGAETSLTLTTRLCELLGTGMEDQRAYDTARMIQQECILRAMYGDTWLSTSAESFEAFVDRLTRMARARFAAA